MELIVSIIIAIILVVAYEVYLYVKKPSKETVKELTQWLLYQVANAEQLFGSKTGKIKLSYVYDKFCSAFPKLSNIMKVDEFNSLVDDTLAILEHLLETNEQISNYVYKEDK